MSVPRRAPPSPPFVAQLVQCKLAADERALLAGKLPLSMTDYVSLQVRRSFAAQDAAA